MIEEALLFRGGAGFRGGYRSPGGRVLPPPDHVLSITTFSARRTSCSRIDTIRLRLIAEKVALREQKDVAAGIHDLVCHAHQFEVTGIQRGASPAIEGLTRQSQVVVDISDQEHHVVCVTSAHGEVIGKTSQHFVDAEADELVTREVRGDVGHRRRGEAKRSPSLLGQFRGGSSVSVIRKFVLFAFREGVKHCPRPLSRNTVLITKEFNGVFCYFKQYLCLLN